MTKTRYLVALLAASACTSAQSNSTPRSTAAAARVDTLVGVVTEVNAMPTSWMSVRVGNESLRLSGEAADILRSVSGTEVWLSGARGIGDFRVDLFEVRQANGVAVDDGTVVVENGKAWLRSRTGTRREIPYAPPQLLAMNGARIWVTRPATNQAPSYGEIRRP